MVIIEKYKGKDNIIRICDPGFHDGLAPGGIKIVINKKGKSFYVSGWYDHTNSIDGDIILLKDFLELFK